MKRVKAFYPDYPGWEIGELEGEYDPTIFQNIFNAQKRGKITPKGKMIRLVFPNGRKSRMG